MTIPLPPLPRPISASEMYYPTEVRAIQRDAMRVALVAAAELCKKEAQEAHARYRSEGWAYDDGGCDMANVLETYIEALEIANG